MTKPEHFIEIDIPTQTLRLREANGNVIMQALVSTAKNGAGERIDSECTPRGQHLIRACIGAGAPMNTVFVSRRPSGELYSPALRTLYPQRDWILTRILWLSGLERGKNRLGEVDTMRRYIYIHGAPDDDRIGVPGSHGCIKMRNDDVIALFELVAAGTHVVIIG